MSVLILVVDDEPDVELLFRQRFRHELKADRFFMDFAQSGSAALQRITDVGSASLRDAWQYACSNGRQGRDYDHPNRILDRNRSGRGWTRK